MMRWLLSIFLLASPAWATPPDWQTIVEDVCPAIGVPKVVAQTIIRQESRGHPYALNVDGRSVLAATYEDAIQHLSQALETTRNIDIGLMQLNWRTWGSVLRIAPTLLLDPAVNIVVGCTLLAGYIEMEGDIVQGMLRYHSATPARQRQYMQHLMQYFAQRP